MKNKKSILLLILAVTMVLSTYIGSAMAYFTTYTEAKGGYVINLEGQIITREDFYEWTKHVTVVSTENSVPVYVRARAFAGDQYELTYSGNGWSRGSDGFYYYNEILYGGQETPELLVHIGNIPEDAVEGDDFNVIVIYEYTPVQYDENGNPYADWSKGEVIR